MDIPPGWCTFYSIPSLRFNRDFKINIDKTKLLMYPSTHSLCLRHPFLLKKQNKQTFYPISCLSQNPIVNFIPLFLLCPSIQPINKSSLLYLLNMSESIITAYLNYNYKSPQGQKQGDPLGALAAPMFLQPFHSPVRGPSIKVSPRESSRAAYLLPGHHGSLMLVFSCRTYHLRARCTIIYLWLYYQFPNTRG